MKIWTASEIETLKARYPHEPNAALARALGVTERMVRGKAHQLALLKATRPGAPARGRNRRAHVWTEEQDAHLRRWWPEVNARMPGRTAAWLADMLGVSRASVQFRASVLGLRTRRFKEPPWSDDELELLDQWLHLPPPTIRKRLAARGFKRTEAAILCQRQRRFGGLQRATGAYSAHQLAEMMGVAPSVVYRWINKGWLKATIRGESQNRAGGPADRWMITPRAVKSFLLDNPTLIQPRGINFVWLMDLFQPAVSLAARPESAPPPPDGSSRYSEVRGVNLPTDYCRCQGAYDGRVCDRAEQCARHLALRTDPPQQFVNKAALLCYSGYSFFVAAPEARHVQR